MNPGIVSRVSPSQFPVATNDSLFLGSAYASGNGCDLSGASTYEIIDTASANQASPAIAGLGVDPPSTLFVLPVKRTAEGVDTALAINNPTNSVATVDFTLFGGPAQILESGQLTFQPKASASMFVVEIFNPSSSQGAKEPAGPKMQISADFTGTLLIVSNCDLGVISLQTSRGVPSASLPGISFSF